MATIQARVSRGHKYWYIVESRRVNGKPRPIVLAYLGKADDLLRRLQGLTGELRLKSYSHGALAALLDKAADLDIPNEINKHIKSPRPYFADQPIRNDLTAGMTLLLAAIGRVCMPTSKRGWWTWAATTSCEYLLRCSLSGIDSLHFWDLMDALPVDAIEHIEKAVVKRALERYRLSTDSLFYDTTNFFTYVHTTNARCDIAQRGKNKQKRADLRQVGLAMVVTQQDFMPLFHLTYRGNLNDSTVFANLVEQLKQRLAEYGLDPGGHTLVFDRGNNSKANLDLVDQFGLNYVGALTPAHHKELIAEAEGRYQEVEMGQGRPALSVFRTKKTVWGKERTILLFVSERLKQGQLRGVYRGIDKCLKTLGEIGKALANPRCKKRSREQLTQSVESATKGQYMQGLFQWEIKEMSEGRFGLTFSLNNDKLSELQERFGLRILMTSRHDWETPRIITAYYGQATIERAFRDIKNPYHLAIRPQFHWTDQKITVHFFICVLGYLLAALLLRELRTKISFRGTMDRLLDTLNNVRLGAIIEQTQTRGRMKATYKLEDMSPEQQQMVEALGIENCHTQKPRISGDGVYNHKAPNQLKNSHLQRNAFLRIINSR